MGNAFVAHKIYEAQRNSPIAFQLANDSPAVVVFAFNGVGRCVRLMPDEAR